MAQGLTIRRTVERPVAEEVVLQVVGVLVTPGRVVVDLQDAPATIPVDRRELSGDAAAGVLKLWDRLAEAALKAVQAQAAEPPSDGGGQ